MVVYIVKVQVKKGFENQFIEASLKNHQKTRKEPGNIRFDLSRSPDTDGLFYLHEVYTNKDAVAAHKETPHYKAWREEVADWMAAPREGTMLIPCFPEEEKAW